MIVAQFLKRNVFTAYICVPLGSLTPFVKRALSVVAIKSLSKMDYFNKLLHPLKTPPASPVQEVHTTQAHMLLHTSENSSIHLIFAFRLLFHPVVLPCSFHFVLRAKPLHVTFAWVLFLCSRPSSRYLKKVFCFTKKNVSADWETIFQRFQLKSVSAFHNYFFFHTKNHH